MVATKSVTQNIHPITTSNTVPSIAWGGGAFGRGPTRTGVVVIARATFYHGTKVDLEPGDLVQPGYGSNFGERRKANYVYLTATVDAATWGAELAVGEEPGRIYRVEPTGPIEDDPNLTDKRFRATRRGHTARGSRCG